MIRLQDIADMVGVSRTTVSNVLHGNTKRVSKVNIDKISAILDEQGYVPNMGSMILTSRASRIIGFIIGYDETHGFNSMQDPFVGAFLGGLEKEANRLGYYIMLIHGTKIDKIVNVASRWNVDGLIALGFNEDDYHALMKKLNKPIVLIDMYTNKEANFVNVGIDDYSGGYQIGHYLYQCGHLKALFAAETNQASDYYRWLGFKQAMEEHGVFCSKSRYILTNTSYEARMLQYERLLPRFLEAGAIAFSSDYAALEGMSFLQDHGIKIPHEISITGFDDNMYTTLIHPRLTTVHQDIEAKSSKAMELLMKIIGNETIENKNFKIPVSLVVRDSVKKCEFK